MARKLVVKLVGLVDGQWLAIGAAKRFTDLAAVRAYYTQVRQRDPLGGRLTPGSGLNRPLTAFTIEVVNAERAIAEARP